MKRVKVPRDEIVRAAYEITVELGVEKATATAIAEKLSCSIQPVYYVFDNMDNLRAAVLTVAQKKYESVLFAPVEGVLPIKAVGINYIRFAKEYPNLFKFIFCTDRQENVSVLDSHMDENKPRIIKLIMEDYGVTDEKKAEDAYIKTGIFCHGLAMMAISKSAKVGDKEVERLITEVFESVLGIKK